MRQLQVSTTTFWTDSLCAARSKLRSVCLFQSGPRSAEAEELQLQAGALQSCLAKEASFARHACLP